MASLLFALKNSGERRMLELMVLLRPQAGLLVLILSLGCSESTDPTTVTGATGSTPVTASASSGGSMTSGGVGGSTAASTTATSSSSATASSSETASASTGAATTGGSASLPADPSAAGITAFLQASGHTDPSWLSVHDTPTTAEIPWHGGAVRVYMSPALVEARTQNPDPLVAPAAPGVMAVKEFYDEANALVGASVIYYPDATLYYYCYGPAGRCSGESPDTTMDAPIWGEASAEAVSSCRGCHAGNIFTELP